MKKKLIVLLLLLTGPSWLPAAEPAKDLQVTVTVSVRNRLTGESYTRKARTQAARTEKRNKVLVGLLRQIEKAPATEKELKVEQGQ